MNCSEDFIVSVSNEIYFWYIIDIDFLDDNPIYI